MATIILRHRVGDSCTWIHAHEEQAEILGQACSSFKTFRDIDEPKSIVLVIESDEPGKLISSMDDPDFAELKTLHTVNDPIVVSAELNV